MARMFDKKEPVNLLEAMREIENLSKMLHIRQKTHNPAGHCGSWDHCRRLSCLGAKRMIERFEKYNGAGNETTFDCTRDRRIARKNEAGSLATEGDGTVVGSD